MSEALRAVWGAKRLWALHVAANAAWLAAAYAWLWFRRASLATRSFPAGRSPSRRDLLLVARRYLRLLRAETFRLADAGGDSVSRTAAARAAADSVGAAGASGVLGGGLRCRLCSARRRLAGLGSDADLPNSRQPEYTLKFLSTLDWVVEWILLPLVLLPWGAEVAAKGFAGFGGRSLAAAWIVFRRGRYWVSYLALFALGIYVPVQLVHWVPEVESLGAQAASLAARFLAAYLMMVTAWLVLASLLGRLRRAQ
jgi:hypothetical protein